MPPLPARQDNDYQALSDARACGLRTPERMDCGLEEAFFSALSCYSLSCYSAHHSHATIRPRIVASWRNIGHLGAERRSLLLRSCRIDLSYWSPHDPRPTNPTAHGWHGRPPLSISWSWLDPMLTLPPRAHTSGNTTIRAAVQWVGYVHD